MSATQAAGNAVDALVRSGMTPGEARARLIDMAKCGGNPATLDDRLELADEGYRAYMAGIGAPVMHVSNGAYPGQSGVMRRRPFYVTDRAGLPVGEGSRVTDFRGEPAVLVSLTRGPGYNGTSKVTVQRGTGPLMCGGPVSEYYATVFDLTVVPAA